MPTTARLLVHTMEMIMPDTMTMAEDLTLPMLAVELRLSLDRLRRLMARRADLAAYCRRVGPYRVVRASDLDAIRTLIGA